MTAVMPLRPEPNRSGVATDRTTNTVAYLSPRALNGVAAPIRSRARALRRVLPLGDALVCVVASVAFAPLGAGSGAVVGRLDVALAVLWVGLLAATRAYQARPVGFDVEDARRVLRAVAALTFAGLLIGSTGAANAETGGLAALAAVTTTAGIAQRWAVAAPLGLGRGRETAMRVVVAGHRRDVSRTLTELRAARAPFAVVAVCLAQRAQKGRTGDFDVPAETGFGNLRTCVAQHRADAVIVIPGRHVDPSRLRQLGWELEATGTHLFVGTGLHEVGPARTSLGHAGSLPLIHVRHAELSGGRRVVKALWERAAAGLALVALAPLLLVLALAIRLESDGPALFRQTRIGKDGAPFTMLKFRSMCADAERQLARLAEAGSDGDVLFKLRADPRVTRLGRFLRRYSLDELPQLINVVRGDMALVGPRPPLPSEVACYDTDSRRRLAVTPGLTGLWQVSGRSDLSWEESVRLDLRYVENWSFGLDLRILCRTFGAVIGHRGAY